MKTSIALPVLVALVAGCSSKEDTSGDAASSQAALRQGCDAYAAALIAKQAECPLQVQDLATGDEVVERLARTCVSLFGAPGSGATKQNLESCASAVGAASCVAFHGDLDECTAPFRGTLGHGDDCLFDSQCESGVCKGSTGASCGTCVNRAGVGEHCGSASADVPCAEGLVCLASSDTSGTCESAAEIATVAEVGTSCTTTCNNPWLICMDGACKEHGGASCSYSYECATGQRCDGYVRGKSEGTCVAAYFGGPGEACDEFEGSYCNEGLRCDGKSKTCRSRIQEEGACSSSEDNCAEGLSCIGGECTVPAIDDYTCGGSRKGSSAF